MNSCTPGPWYATDLRQQRGGQIVIRSAAPHYDHVANVMARSPNAEANARLIAAAPDLLAACQHVRAHLAHALRWRCNESEQRLLDLLDAVLKHASTEVCDVDV